MLDADEAVVLDVGQCKVPTFLRSHGVKHTPA
jgi:hypothetical protein